MTGARTLSSCLPLPEAAYLPGQTERPSEDAFDFPELVVDQEFGSFVPENTVAWHYGLRLLGAGCYWEAHEVLEPVWMACEPNSRERFVVQAVIQIANAALKARMEKPNATRKLLVIAIDLLKRAGTGRATVVGVAANESAKVLAKLLAEKQPAAGDIARSFLQYNALGCQRSKGKRVDK